MAASEAASRGTQAEPTPRPVASVRPRIGGGLTIALIALAAGSVGFGYLDDAGGHPTLKLGVALALTVLGLGTVLLVRLLGEGDGAVFVDVARTTLALLSMTAALIHLAVVAQHFSEYWLYGWFFILVGVFQLAWAPLVVVRPARPLLVAGGLVNAAVAIAWVVTRTYGAVVGPDASKPASAGFGDIASTLVEVLIVVGVLLVVSRGSPRASVRTSTGDVLSGLVALVVVPVTVLALYSAVAGHPFVSHVG